MSKYRILTLGLLLILGWTSAHSEGIPRLDSSIAGFVGMSVEGPLDTPTSIGSTAEFDAVFGAETEGLANPYLAPSVAGFFANGGTRLYIVRVAGADDGSLIGVDGGAPGSRTGLQALIDVDEVSIVAIPGAVSLAVQSAEITHCEAMGERMAVLDPASLDDLGAVLAQRASLNAASGHAALYFPWIQAEPAGTSLLLPPSGLVAGVYSATAASDSPVGNIATATGVSRTLNTQESDLLTQAGIDPIRLFGLDVRIWGARTLASDPEWRYVAVRRTGLFLEESIHDGTEWALLEPNDEILWAALRQCIGEFMFQLWLDGWFPGATPPESYFVRVDLSTMTQQDLDEGRTIILVGFAPLQPAEFVVLRIVHQREESTDAPVSSPLGRSLAAIPNPFTITTTVEFELPRTERTSVRIYDARGRFVRSLLDRTLLEAGVQSLIWDGRDARGERVPSGIYLPRIESRSVRATGRVLFLE